MNGAGVVELQEYPVQAGGFEVGVETDVGALVGLVVGVHVQVAFGVFADDYNVAQRAEVVIEVRYGLAALGKVDFHGQQLAHFQSLIEGECGLVAVLAPLQLVLAELDGRVLRALHRHRLAAELVAAAIGCIVLKQHIVAAFGEGERHAVIALGGVLGVFVVKSRQVFTHDDEVDFLLVHHGQRYRRLLVAHLLGSVGESDGLAGHQLHGLRLEPHLVSFAVAHLVVVHQGHAAFGAFFALLGAGDLGVHGAGVGMAGGVAGSAIGGGAGGRGHGVGGAARRVRGAAGGAEQAGGGQQGNKETIH